MKRLLLAFIIILSFCLLLVSCDSEETRGEQGPQGIQGEQGIQGPQGPKGEDGEDGRGVEKFEIIDGELIIYYTDGTSQNLGKIQDEKDDPEEEGTAGLEYHELDDGTLAVGLGTVKFLTKIVIPSKHDGKVVSTIMDEGFKGYDKLKSIEIPDSITAIGNNAFYGCTSLESIVIPNSVTTIGSSAFYGCSSLTSVTIPDGVTSIGNATFRDCTSLESVVIPNSVTTIGNYAFYECTSLTNIIIPNSVTTIGSDAFSYCTLLTIYCEAQSKPSGWHYSWNLSNRPVEWGHTHSYTGGKCVCGKSEN